MNNLAGGNDTIHELLLPMDRADVAEGSRTLVFDNLPSGERFLELRIADRRGSGDAWIKLPLGKTRTCPKETEREHWDDILVPVVPLAYADAERTRSGARALPEGWLYVFCDGELWRELRVVERSYMRDVDLAHYKGKDVREATGAPDIRIVVPHKIGGKKKTVEMCFSRVQWSWKQIERASGYGKEATNYRIARTIELPLEKFADDFNIADGDVGPICDAPAVPLVSLQRNSRLPVVYLDDPIGVAQELKAAHFAAVADVEFLSSQMDEEDYPLARLINSLIKNEDLALKDHPGTRDSGGPTIRECVNADKLNGRLRYWEKLGEETNRKSYEAGLAVAEWMARTRGDGAKVCFEMALEEYLRGNTPERFALGMSIWCELVEYFYFREGRDYLKKIVIQESTLGECLCNPSPEQAEVVAQLEAGKYFPKRNDGYHLTGKDAIGLISFGAKVLSSLVGTLAQAKAGEGIEGLDWVAELIRKYLPDIEVAVRTAPVHLMWTGIDTSQPHHYRLIPLPSEVEKRVRAEYLHLGDADLPKSAQTLQNSLVYRRGFGSLLVVLEVINLASAINALGRELEKEPRQVTVMASSILSGIASLTGLAEKAMDVAAGRREARYRELEMQYRRKYAATWEKGRQAGTVSRPSFLEYDKSITNDLARTRQSLRTLHRAREVAATASRITGQLAAYAELGIAAWDLDKALRSGNRGEQLWAGVNLGAMMISAMGLNQATRLSGVVFQLRTAAGVTMLAGESTAVSGWGLALFVLGLGLEFVAGAMLGQYKPDELRAAIKYGFFGTAPYEKSLWFLPSGPYAEPDNAVVRREALDYEAPPAVASLPAVPHVRDYVPWATKPELQRLYHFLFDYKPEVKVWRTGETVLRNRRGVATPMIDPDGEQVVVGEIVFSQFLPRESTLEVEFVIKYAGEYDKQIVRMDGIIAEEQRKGDVLEKLTCYYPAARGRIAHVEMRCLLDVHGDGEFLVPIQPPRDGDVSPEKREVQKRVSEYQVSNYLDDDGDRKYRRELTERRGLVGRMRRDFYRRVLAVMDRVERAPDYDMSDAVRRIGRLHAWLLREEAKHRGVLEDVMCLKPGSAEWERLAKDVERYV